MNEALNCLMTRRSVRSYSSEQIKDSDLEAVVKAGLYAPSAMNMQSWHFVVIRNKEVIDRIDALCQSHQQRTTNPFYNAPTIIIVFADKTCREPVKDGSLALGNMMNAAHALGLASCWINAVNAMFETEEGKVLKSELMPDENYKSVGSIALGYPSGEYPTVKPRKENAVTYID